MSEGYSREIKQRQLNIRKIEADIDILESEFKMLIERLGHIKYLEKKIAREQSATVSGTNGKACYFCDDIIRINAKVCKYCYKVQPDYLIDTAKAKVHIATLLHERVEALRNNGQEKV